MSPLPSWRGELVHGLAGRGDVRWAVADLRGVVEEARVRHDLSPVAAAALGRALAGAALLMFLSTRAWARLVLEVRGDGPLGTVVAEIDDAGNLRGFVGNPRVETAAGEGLGIAAAIGRGVLKVRRESPRWGSFESQVELVTGEIGLDLAHYLEQSEQTRSAVLLGVLARPEGVAAAGGMLVELLPDAREEAIAPLERNLQGLDGVSRRLEQGGLPALAEAVLAGLDHDELGRQPLRFGCRCHRDELLGKLRLLPPGDRDELVAASGEIVAECAFCGQLYRFAATELAPG
ncbi:MAG TPA: Hsp33 family molecular chaperone HslO [Thermoanaerobaculia bacterium]|jgi:molecular chaperone Hsp33|nr:Hsp33 family molecular chaperone HslO [Thermoanaerobaculia bacterium]